MDFNEAERKFADLKHQRDSGQLFPAEFTSRVHEIRLQDNGGVWWQINEQNGKWLRWDGSAWMPGEPVRNVASYAAVIQSAAADREQKRKYVIIGLLGLVVIAYIAYSTIGGTEGTSGGILPVSPGSGGVGYTIRVTPVASPVLSPVSSPGYGETLVKKYVNAVDNGRYEEALQMLPDSQYSLARSLLNSPSTMQQIRSKGGSNGEYVEISDLQIYSGEASGLSAGGMQVSNQDVEWSCQFSIQGRPVKNTLTQDYTHRFRWHINSAGGKVTIGSTTVAIPLISYLAAPGKPS